MSNDSQSKVILEKIPEIEEDDGFEGNFTFEEFASLFDKVTQVNANKEEARLLVLDAANEADVYEWNNFYRKILLKKLHLDLPMPVIIETLKELTGYQNPL